MTSEREQNDKNRAYTYGNTGSGTVVDGAIVKFSLFNFLLGGLDMTASGTFLRFQENDA